MVDAIYFEDETGGVTFADFHHYADLATATTYTPPVNTFGFFQAEDIAAADVSWFFHDGGGWVGADSGAYGGWTYFSQNDDQDVRVLNGDPANLKISFTGRTWTGFTDFHHYADLASGATYTPTAQSFGMFLSEDIAATEVHPQFWDGAGWNSDGSYGGTYWEQDNAQNIRFINDAGGALKISLTGATWA